MIRAMRKVLAILLLCFCVNLVVGDQWINRGVHRRDESATSSSSITEISASPSSTTGDNGGSTTTSGTVDSSIASTTADSSSNNTSAASTTVSVTAATSNIVGAVQTTSSDGNESVFNSTLTPQKLPIMPVVTPGFGVAGAILLVTGLIYTTVGIKKNRLQIYLSATYLASLATTVLIVYVMNPPVSNAIQGAYVVAVIMTGLIIGAAAIFFKELTEGLGCLLGGFCLSMWLLTLKRGGLIKSTSGKAIFIAVFTVVAFATTFSHYTRPYGLIGFISFGGATAVVLGIDCFSRAGLKEFWAYVWDVNDNLFPFGATTYPLTKGIKVESAAIIILFLAGVIFQLKLWKIVKERREQRAKERLEDQRTNQQEEENVGRRIEQDAAEDRDKWEAVYGDKDTVTTAVGSIRDSGFEDTESKKGPTSTVTSLKRQEGDAIEMAEMSPTGAALVMEGRSSSADTTRDVQDEHEAKAEEAGQSAEIYKNRLSHVSKRISVRQSQQEEPMRVVGGDGEARFERRSSQRNSARNSVRNSRRPSKGSTSAAAEGQGHVNVPNIEVQDDHRSSIAQEEPAQKIDSNRLSTSSATILRRLSNRSKRRSQRFSRGEDTEDLVSPIEDDRASSVAATWDEDSDEDMRSQRSSLRSLQEAVDTSGIESHRSGSRPVSALIVATNILDGDKTESPVSSLTQSTDFRAENSAAIPQKADSVPQRSSFEARPSNITEDRLPQQLPKVAMSFRTNEWAKHINAEDAPPDEQSIAGSPTESEGKGEIPAPVNVEELQQKAGGAPRASRSVSQMSSHPVPVPVRTNSAQSRNITPQINVQPQPERSVSQQFFYGQSSQPQPERSVSQQSSYRQSPQDSVLRGLRSSSSPLTPQAIVESPSEGDINAFPNQAFVPGTTRTSIGSVPFGSNKTLLGQRDTMLRNKHSYYETTPLAPTPERPGSQFQSQSVSGSEAGSIYNLRNSTSIPDDDDNMSLSARRDLLRQSLIQQAPAPTPTPNPYQNPQQSQQPPNPQFDSHQPKRQSSAPHSLAREQQLASFRASIQQDLKSNVRPKFEIEKQRSVLWQERQAQEQRKEVQKMQKGKRDEAFDVMMRRGDMLDAHREVMRRMQAGARAG